jgi:FkbM family methyltransferase
VNNTYNGNAMTEDVIRSIVREEIQANNAAIEQKIEYFTNLLPFATYMGDDIVLTKSYFNVMYLVYSHDSIVAPYLIKNAVYETELTKYLLNNIKADSVFVDVGANIGYYTCLANKKIFSGKVFAFEPNELAFRLLQRNVMINWPNCPVSVENVAVGKCKGEVYFKNYKYRFVNSQILAGEEEGEINTGEITRVPVIPLDEYFPRDQRIDFLKVDVEGAELDVLMGAKITIANNPHLKILMEWSVDQLKNQNTNPIDVLRFLSGHGFMPSQLDWKDGSSTPITYEFIERKEYICSVLFEKHKIT